MNILIIENMYNEVNWKISKIDDNSILYNISFDFYYSIENYINHGTFENNNNIDKIITELIQSSIIPIDYVVFPLMCEVKSIKNYIREDFDELFDNKGNILKKEYNKFIIENYFDFSGELLKWIYDTIYNKLLSYSPCSDVVKLYYAESCARNTNRNYSALILYDRGI